MSGPGKSLRVTIWRKSKMKWGQKWNIGSAEPHGKILWAALDHIFLKPPSPPLPRATAHLLLPPTCRDCGWPWGALGDQHYPPSAVLGPRSCSWWLPAGCFSLDYPQDAIQNQIGVASNPPLDLAWERVRRILQKKSLVSAMRHQPALKCAESWQGLGLVVGTAEAWDTQQNGLGFPMWFACARCWKSREGLEGMAEWLLPGTQETGTIPLPGTEIIPPHLSWLPSPAVPP